MGFLSLYYNKMSIFYAIVFGVIIHHAYKHRLSGEDPLYGLDQYFYLYKVTSIRFGVTSYLSNLNKLASNPWYSLLSQK